MTNVAELSPALFIIVITKFERKFAIKMPIVAVIIVARIDGIAAYNHEQIVSAALLSSTDAAFAKAKSITIQYRKTPMSFEAEYLTFPLRKNSLIPIFSESTSNLSQARIMGTRSLRSLAIAQPTNRIRIAPIPDGKLSIHCPIIIIISFIQFSSIESPV